MMGVLTRGAKLTTSNATSSAWMAKELNLLHTGTFHAHEASQICKNSSSATGNPATVAVAGEEAPEAECSWTGRYFLM
jgi:hypothetical protein